jgi:hypothetical protein
VRTQWLLIVLGLAVVLLLVFGQPTPPPRVPQKAAPTREPVASPPPADLPIPRQPAIESRIAAWIESLEGAAVDAVKVASRQSPFDATDHGRIDLLNCRLDLDRLPPGPWAAGLQAEGVRSLSLDAHCIWRLHRKKRLLEVVELSVDLHRIGRLRMKGRIRNCDPLGLIAARKLDFFLLSALAAVSLEHMEGQIRLHTEWPPALFPPAEAGSEGLRQQLALVADRLDGAAAASTTPRCRRLLGQLSRLLKAPADVDFRMTPMDPVPLGHLVWQTTCDGLVAALDPTVVLASSGN